MTLEFHIIQVLDSYIAEFLIKGIINNSEIGNYITLFKFNRIKP